MREKKVKLRYQKKMDIHLIKYQKIISYCFYKVLYSYGSETLSIHMLKFHSSHILNATINTSEIPESKPTQSHNWAKQPQTEQ